MQKIFSFIERALIGAAKKTNMPLYRQSRMIELECRIIKLNSQRMALELEA